MESVSDQISNFEDLLFDSIEFQLIVHTNRAYWEENDTMDTDSANGLENAVAFGFEQILRNYKYNTDVTKILESWYDLIQDVLWIATDVPYPFAYELHMDRIIANCKSLFNMRFRNLLERAMIRGVSKIQIIQRTWREARWNPERAMCRNRLGREFDTLNEELCRFRENGSV